jgi:putative ABC transport system permease protein
LDPVRYSAVLVVPGDLADVPALADRIRAAGYTLLGGGQVPASVDRTFRLLDIGLGVLGVLASLGSALGVAQVLASRMSERTSEIGLLKALGATDRQVAALIATEAVMLGLVGGVVGVAAGWAGAHAISGVAEFVFGPVSSPRLTLGLAVVSPFLTTLLACLAAIGPARRAWRLRPADALRHR